MDDAERVFLEDTMTKLGLSEDERDQVRNFESSGAEDVVKTMSNVDKVALRDDLLTATLADGNISPLETKVVKYITELLDL